MANKIDQCVNTPHITARLFKIPVAHSIQISMFQYSALWFTTIRMQSEFDYLTIITLKDRLVTAIEILHWKEVYCKLHQMHKL